MSYAAQTDDLIAQADIALANGNLPVAAEQLTRAVEASPSHGLAWKKLAMAQVGLQNYVEGEKSARTASALLPTDADVYYALGYSLVQLQQPEAAIAELDKALNLNVHHEGARQVLNAALIQAGHSLREDDPHRAENYLQRAHKLYPEAPGGILALLEFFQLHHAKGKVTSLVKELSPQLMEEPTIKAKLENLARDSEFANAIRMATVSLQAAAPQTAARPAQSGVQYKPCPNCKQMIADFAAICPHCNFQNRATGTFAGRDAGPAYAWQDIALTIVMVLNLALSGFMIFVGLQAKIEMVKALICTIWGAQFMLSLAVLFRNDFAMTILKYLCYLAALQTSFGTMVNFMMGDVLGGFISLFSLAFTCFIIYLLNWAGD
jgi:Tfp pilus assembly protein PilF